MSYNEDVMRIECIANGYEVECYEPVPKKKTKDGHKMDGMSPSTPYVDPWKEYAFKTVAEVVAFIAKKLPELERNASKEYDDAFEEASSYMGDD